MLTRIIYALSAVTMKDWMILLAFIVLILCLFEIQRLKSVIANDTKRRLTPQLMLDLVLEAGSSKMGLYLKNEWFFITQDIRIEPIIITMELGFTKKVMMEFDHIDILKPHEVKQLTYKVLDMQRNYLPEATAKIIPHLASPSFKVNVIYRNMEGVQFCARFYKKGKVFFTEMVDLVEERK